MGTEQERVGTGTEMGTEKGTEMRTGTERGRKLEREREGKLKWEQELERLRSNFKHIERSRVEQLVSYKKQ